MIEKYECYKKTLKGEPAMAIFQSDIVLSDGEIIPVESGEYVSNVVVNSGGSLLVLSDGIANSTTVNSYGYLRVSSGGTATDTLENGGYVSVEDGAEVNFAPSIIQDLLLKKASATIHSGTTATCTTASSGGKLYVSSGGSALDNTVNSGGSLAVHSGGSAADNIVHYGGSFTVHSGGSAAGIVEDGGYVLIEDGAEAEFVPHAFSGAVLSKRSATVHSGTTANSTTLISGGSLAVYSGGIAADTVVNVNGNLLVSSGGIASSTTINSGGRMSVSSGGTAIETIVNTLVSFTVGKGVVANDTTVIDGRMVVGGIANGIQLNIGESISSSSYLSNYKNSMGVLYISSGGTANDITVNSGARVYVSDCGTVNSVTVNSGASIYVSSGGIATEIMENGGAVVVSSGAKVTFVSNTFSGLVLSGSSGSYAGATVHSGTTANSTFVGEYGSFLVAGLANGVTVFRGQLLIEPGGQANDIVLSGRNVGMDSATMVVNGTANRTKVCSGGIMVIGNDGKAVNIAIERYGKVEFRPGTPKIELGFSSNRIISGITISSGGSLATMAGWTTLTGQISIASGAVISSPRENYHIFDLNISDVEPDAEVRFRGLSTLSKANSGLRYNLGFTVSDSQKNGTYKLIEDNTFIYSIHALKASGEYVGVIMAGQVKQIGEKYYLMVSPELETSVICADTPVFSGILVTNPKYATIAAAGQVFSDVTVGSGGTFIVSSGGAATDIAWTPGAGHVFVREGGYAGFATSYSGVYYASDGIPLSSAAEMDSMTLGALEDLNVFSGGTANGTTVGSGGCLAVFSGGTAMEIVENGGYVNIADSTDVSFASNTIPGLVVSGYSATIHSGTTANNATVRSSGCIVVFSGGVADDATISDWGSMSVDSGAVVNRTLLQGGSFTVSSGGIVNGTVISGLGYMYVESGGIATDTTLSPGEIGGGYGSLFVSSGGTATGIVVSSGCEILVSSGGTATDLLLEDGYYSFDIAPGTYIAFAGTEDEPGYVIEDGYVSGYTVSSGGRLFVHSGATAKDVMIQGGQMSVFSGGTASGISVNGWGVGSGILQILSGGMANEITVSSGGYLYVSSGGIVHDAMIDSLGRMLIESGGTAVNATISGILAVSSGGKLTGLIAFANDKYYISAYYGAIIDFDISGLAPLADARIKGLSNISGAPVYTLTVSGMQTSGVYTLAEGAAEFDGTITVQNTSGEEIGAVTVGKTLKVGYDSYTLNLTDSVLSVTVEVPDLTPTESTGSADQVSWKTTGANGYVVEYSTDNFEHVISVVTTGNAIDMPDLPPGTYQWRVKADANSDWAVGEELVSEGDPDVAPKVVQAVEDGNDDLFFASPNGTWTRSYCAQHLGSLKDGWKGTNEKVSANGKGRIQNLFFGSADPNVLCLTDSLNGDALFVDDIYTDLPKDVEMQTARLYKIKEIRAGAGDDIVDMTSNRFEYTGEGLTIRGGDGNDVIWANNGDNMLFGDAGNDRIVGASGNDVIAGGIGNDSMHGGGGEDVFSFCENWGADEVGQLVGGSVTLWFASGIESNWDASTLTYTDGDNSVTVSGVDAEQITLKFGAGSPDDAEQFAALSAMGAFDAFTSRRVFEETNGGLLASS